jgi:hypothetical protein
MLGEATPSRAVATKSYFLTSQRQNEHFLARGDQASTSFDVGTGIAILAPVSRRFARSHITFISRCERETLARVRVDNVSLISPGQAYSIDLDAHSLCDPIFMAAFSKKIVY